MVLATLEGVDACPGFCRQEHNTDAGRQRRTKLA
jgi:hypothetical protein